MKNILKKFVIPPVITLLFAFVYFYFAIPAINWRSFEFWAMVILVCAVFLLSYCYINVENFGGAINGFFKKLFSGVETAQGKSKRKEKSDYVYYYGKLDGIRIPKWVKITAIALGIAAVLFVIIAFLTSTRIFNASSYQTMLNVTESDFSEDIAEIPISQIPIVDRDTAERLGSRKIGEVVELVSQFDVSSYYSQINYNNKPFRVSPLEYAGFLKWFSNMNEGIPYYVKIDMATQETTLVELTEGIKYSPSEYFVRDLYRHIRFAYPTKMFENLSFEIQDDGHPYWVMSYYDYTIGLFGGKDITGIILVDAISGEMTDYKISEVPQWIDHVYSSEMLLEQANNWGSLTNGWLNSVFVQRNVVVTTEGYNYIAVDDDVWLYTGITSVSADESNIGFILINMRTKEAKTYYINGAEEYSAMESAEGQIQEKGYVATFPILINVYDRPTYFISLKDMAGLVKAYAFVSVSDYQIVGVADNIADAQKEYLRMLGIQNDPDDAQTSVISGTVSAIATAVKDGNSLYYIQIGTDIYTADISVSNLLPFLKVGDSISANVTSDNIIKTIEIVNP